MIFFLKLPALFIASILLCLGLSAQQPELILPVGHTEDIFLTQFVGDGKYIITCAYDNTAKLWDVYSGKLLHTFSDLLHDPDYSPKTELSKDRKHLIALTKDGYLKKWELPSAKLIFSIKNKSIPISDFKCSDDDRYILINTGSNSFNSPFEEVLDASNGRLLYTLEINKINDLPNKRNFEFCPGGKYILVQRDNSLYLHYTANGKLVRKLEQIEHLNEYYPPEFSPDGKYVVIDVKGSDQLRLWQVSDGDVHQVTVSGTIEFSPDSKYILSTRKDIRKLTLTDAVSGDVIHRFEEETTNGNELGHFSHDGKYIFLSGPPYSENSIKLDGDSITQIWESKSQRHLYSLQGQRGNIYFVKFSPDNKYISTITESGIIQLWETAIGNQVRSFNGRNVEFSTDGKNLAITNRRTVEIFSLGLNSILSILKGHSNSLTRAIFSPDEKQVITLSNEKKARLWNISKGIIAKTIEEGSQIKDAIFSRDGKNSLITTEAGEARVKNSITGKEIFTLDQKEIKTASLSPDGRQIITTADSSICIWDAVSGKKLYKFSEHYYVNNAAISVDGRFAYYIFGQTAVGILNIATGRVFKDYLGEEEIWSCQFSPDSKYVFILGEKGTAKLFENATGKMINQLNERSRSEYAVNRIGGYYYQNLWETHFQHFSPDGKYLVFRRLFDNYIVIRNMDNLAVIDTIFGNGGLNNLIINAAFVPNTDQLVTGSRDDTIRIWKKEKNGFGLFKKFYGNGFEISPGGKWLLVVNNVQLMFYDLQAQQFRYKTLAVNENDYFTQLPDKPYYAASKNATKELMFRLDDHYFSFDQFDVQLNRPDIVLQAIDNKDTSLINAYRKAYFKRIKKLGIDTSSSRNSYSVPEADFVNRDTIEYEQKVEKLPLHVKGIDRAGKLVRFNIWVNEVPAFGQRGIHMSNRIKNAFDTTIAITLSQGENHIETSVTNNNGKESYRVPLMVNYDPPVRQTEIIHFIGIGIDKFADNKYNLQFSVKDIRDLSLKLKEKFPDIIIDTLFNEQVTLKNVKELKQKLQQTTENDKVIIAYSGHGLLSSVYDYYLSTFDVNFGMPEQNGLAYEELENLLDNIPARKKLMLVDACHSGEVDKDEEIAMNKMADSLGLSRGVIIRARKQQKQAGLNNSFELMQSLFVNVSKGTGAIIISAAAGNQFALERGGLKHGVFTYSILEAMDKYPTMKISELKKVVGERVEQLTNGMQKPTSRNETIAVDWNVW